MSESARDKCAAEREQIESCQSKLTQLHDDIFTKEQAITDLSQYTISISINVLIFRVLILHERQREFLEHC